MNLRLAIFARTIIALECNSFCNCFIFSSEIFGTLVKSSTAAAFLKVMSPAIERLIHLPILQCIVDMRVNRSCDGIGDQTHCLPRCAVWYSDWLGAAPANKNSAAVAPTSKFIIRFLPLAAFVKRISRRRLFTSSFFHVEHVARVLRDVPARRRPEIVRMVMVPSLSCRSSASRASFRISPRRLFPSSTHSVIDAGSWRL